jgi:hypothetical protein
MRGHRVGDRSRDRRDGGEVHDGVRIRDRDVQEVGVQDRTHVQVDVQPVEVRAEPGGQIVDDRHATEPVVRRQHPDEVRADEAGPTGDHDAHVRCPCSPR